MMKDEWKNNLGLKIMAVLFAVILWWTVVNVDDPIREKKYMTEVVIVNPEVVTNAGKSYQIDEATKRVTVTVKARRKILNKMKASDIVATADLMEMQEMLGTVPIRIRIDGFEGEYAAATANPRNIQITTEDTQKKTFPIQIAATGEVRDGHILDKINTAAEPKTIDISGPKSLVTKISRVVAKVDVSELSEDTVLKANLIYYDSADNIIDQSQLSSNCDKNGVMVYVKLLETKILKVEFDTSKINPGHGYVFRGLEVEPQAIEVAGTEEQLAGLQYLKVGSEALQQDGITSNVGVTVAISDYLPAGIKLVNEDAGTVVVRIILEKVGTKSILLPVRSIKVNDVPDDFELSYGPEQEIELQFSGASDVLESLTSEKIIALIDLAQYKEEGTYDVPVKVTEAPNNCEYLGGATIQITLTKK